MGSMVLDAVRVNAFILPNLTKAKNSLTEAAKYGNSVERYAGDSPISSRSNVNAARVRNLASNLTKRLGTISSNINTVSVKLDAKLEKAKLIEKKNKAKSTALSAAVGAVAGAAGAAIGAATGGIKGAVVGAAIGAAAGVAAKKTNVFSSIGKALKNTGAKIAKNVGSFFSGVWKGIKNIGKSIANACKKIAKKVVSFVKEKIGPIIKDIARFAVGVVKAVVKTCATIVNLAVSLVEGVVSLVEALGDAVLIVAGAVATVGAALVACGYWLFTGDWKLGEWSGAIWKKWCMPWVGYNWTDKLFDGVEKINVFDKLAWDWGKRKGGDGTACKIAKGVGYVAGIIVASVFTAGAAGAGAAAGSGIGAGATAVGSLFAGSSTALAGTLIPSTVIAGVGKFGQKAQDNYNSTIDKSVKAHYIEQLKLANPGLSDDEIKALYDYAIENNLFTDKAQVRKSAMDNISGGKIAGILGTSATQGVIEAATWYVTYGSTLTTGGVKQLSGAETLAKSKSKLLSNLGKAVGDKSKFAWTQNGIISKVLPNFGKASVTKAGIQFAKGYANEGATLFLDGDFDVSKAHTDAVVGAATSIVYDNTLGTWMKNAASTRMEKANQISESADDIMNAAGSETAKKTMKDRLDSIITNFLNYGANDTGGKKIVGGGIKNIYKEIGKDIIEATSGA
jgi:hypothetical protein